MNNTFHSSGTPIGMLKRMFRWNSTITIGASNLLNNRPPVNGRETTGFDPNAYGAGVLGRFAYIRIRKEF